MGAIANRMREIIAEDRKATFVVMLRSYLVGYVDASNSRQDGLSPERRDALKTDIVSAFRWVGEITSVTCSRYGVQVEARLDGDRKMDVTAVYEWGSNAGEENAQLCVDQEAT